MRTWQEMYTKSVKAIPLAEEPECNRESYKNAFKEIEKALGEQEEVVSAFLFAGSSELVRGIAAKAATVILTDNWNWRRTVVAVTNRPRLLMAGTVSSGGYLPFTKTRYTVNLKLLSIDSILSVSYRGRRPGSYERIVLETNGAKDVTLDAQDESTTKNVCYKLGEALDRAKNQLRSQERF